MTLRRLDVPSAAAEGASTRKSREVDETASHPRWLLTLPMMLQALARPEGVGRERVLHSYPAALDAAYGGYFTLGRLFAKMIGNPTFMKQATRHGLPRTPSDLGLCAEQFAQAVSWAPSTRPDRYTILDHLDLGEEEVANRVRAYVQAYGR